MVIPTQVWISLCVVLLGAGHIGEGHGGDKEDKKTNKTVAQEMERQGKVFALFNVVQFKNDPCVSTSSISGGSTAFRNGTCYTSSECVEKSGTSAGNCAAGFGVCCVFTTTTCGSTISNNNTYIQNPGFPSAYTDTADCSYTIQKCNSDICSLRLDFESFTIQGPIASSEATEGVCDKDTFTASVTNNFPIPVICGLNSGQHMYLDVSGSSDTATLAFAFDGTTATRNWDIKVTQISCFADEKPPNGCLQYSTGIVGRFSTFNFLDGANHHLADQRYSHCIRQEEGYCCIEYSACPDNLAFTLGPDVALPMIDTECTLDYIIIEGGSATCDGLVPANSVTKFCGALFSPSSSASGATMSDTVCDCSSPFSIAVVTDATSDAVPPTAVSRGACLEWRQLPC